MIEYGSFFAPQNYWDSLNRMKKTSYIKKYHAENGIYPSQVQINSIVLSEEEIEKYNRYYYAKYLAKLSANGDLSDSETNDPSIEYDNTPNFSEWIELPFTYKEGAETLEECFDENLEYYCHYFSVGDEKYRNYSFAWSQKDRISKWVAYPLHRNSVYMEHNVARTDAWALDPILGEKSSAPFSQYAGDYARGKLIPSSHRMYSEESNSQIFYGSNIIPMDVNVQAGVDSEVNAWILRSATYPAEESFIVSGVITDENSIVVTDSYGNNVTVPNRIYKLAWFIEPHSISNNSHYICCSYNNNADNINFQYHTIEELSTMTGMLYFYNARRNKNSDYEKCYNNITPQSDILEGLEKYM